MSLQDLDKEQLSAVALHDIWFFLVQAERVEGFKLLSPPDAQHLFLGLPSRDQARREKNLLTRGIG
jgi:hypothetical protein